MRYNLAKFSKEIRQSRKHQRTENENVIDTVKEIIDTVKEIVKIHRV